MNRRKFVKVCGRGSLALAASSLWPGGLNSLLARSGSGDKPWNIVFILSDDQGWNQVRYHGVSDFYDTPNIDRIAHEGIYFTDAYTAAPVCSPARASILTGKYPARLHLTDYLPGNRYPYAKLKTPQQVRALPLEEVTIAELLKQQGYVTGHFGKWHLNYDKNYQPGRPGDPGSQGFDVVYTSVKPKPDADPDKDAHHAIEITRRTLEFIEHNKDRPFFAYVSHHVVHRPLMENKDLINYYKTKPHHADPVNNPIMGAMIKRMDWGIGKILDKLDALGLAERTVVVFFSDNGGFKYLQDQAPLRGGKAMVFEGGIRVPFAIRWPGVIQPGSVSHVPVISNDFFPTFAEIAGAQVPDGSVDGVSLMPLLTGGGTLPERALCWHYPHYHRQGFKPSGAIRWGEYKLIEWYEQTLLNEEHQVDLYRITEDMSENNNLADRMPEKVKQLREMFHKWLKDVNAQMMTVNPDFDPEKQYWPEKDWPQDKDYEYLDMLHPNKQG
ncbi:MAG: sulfatase [Calditrichaeota bacterium]|nr:MAG: sulfatase [Calditrichota bacterium]